jgi:two-component system chemotaxis sensor kinase CheA
MQRMIAEMHGAILQLRMVPVGQLFRSFPRLVRDISVRLNKNVVLTTKGESTESDKNILDRLFEPLMHIIRNALDHGVETNEQRRLAGKAETATISLEASRQADRLIITVSDDGRGIDPDIIRQKARERQLLPNDALDAMSDEQVIGLIFAAGLSTASAVSDISGRGVGMDVVRDTVEQLSGRVSLSSKKGQGTTVRLDLPISIALSKIMVVEAGGQLFGIAMESVSETIRLTPDRISRIKGNEGFVLRDQVVPICSLAELMKLPKPASESETRLLIIAESAGKKIALEVSAIRARLDAVLKPMHGLLANAPGYAGTTLLGDGNVLLVLDLREILK